MKAKPRRRKSCQSAAVAAGGKELANAAKDLSPKRLEESRCTAEFFVAQPPCKDESKTEGAGIGSPVSNKRKRSEEAGQPCARTTGSRRPSKRGRTVSTDQSREPKSAQDDSHSTLHCTGRGDSSLGDENGCRTAPQPGIDSFNVGSMGDFRARSTRRRHTTAGTEKRSGQHEPHVCETELSADGSGDSVSGGGERSRRASSPALGVDEGIDSTRYFAFNICCMAGQRRALRHGSTRSSYPDANLQMMKRRAQICADSVKADYFKGLPATITPRSRCIVTQWMVYVQRKLPSPLNPFSLHVAISLLDRFLSSLAADDSERAKNTLKLPAGKEREKMKESAADNLENIGAACLFIASKLEDVWPVDVKDLCTLSNGEVTMKCVLSWEMRILAELDFDVNFPTLLDFLYFLLHSAGAFPVESQREKQKAVASPEVLTDDSVEKDPAEETTDQATDSEEAPLLKSDVLMRPADWQPRFEWGKGRSALEATAEYLSEVVLMHHSCLCLPSYQLAAACLFAAITYLSKTERRMSNLPQAILDVVAATPEDRDVFRVAAARVCAVLEEHDASTPDGDAEECEDEDSGDVRLINFAGDVDAKHKDACVYLLSAYTKWKTTFSAAALAPL
eukprot:Polyplicarium_translucidae@DN2955_c0_g1_i1.p1